MFTYKTSFDSIFDARKSLVYFEDDEFYVYALEVPYFKKEDLEVTFKNGKIFVDGEKEIYGQHFDTTVNFRVHSDYTEEDIIVEYMAGVLFFKLPKTTKTKDKSKLKIM
jgi:HSP20 family molecular chaperone IbpA